VQSELGGECDFPPPSRPGEKTTARRDQAGKASTGDGAGDANAIADEVNRGVSAPLPL